MWGLGGGQALGFDIGVKIADGLDVQGAYVADLTSLLQEGLYGVCYRYICYIGKQ